ncbi:hypothetical protein EOM39_01610 [Candidatus Gracilibacteria bacterium]|nr:hypothetical protein [Candidatus Gracilibacteria bacterium]
MRLVLKILLSLFVLIQVNNTFAATVDHFDVKLGSSETSVNKSVDLTIEAKDKSGNIVKDYKGTILILSETDTKAELPKEIKDNSYTFKTSDQGKVKFENSLVFKSVGKQEINVFDLDNEDIFGVGEINVVGESQTQDISIEILSPEDGVIIGTNYVTISGKTQKNHKVKIKINGTEVKSTNSNGEGLFEEKITDLENGDSVIVASVLDSDSKIVGTSKEIKITVKADNPIFNSIKITPTGDLEPESKINIEVNATKGLERVNVIINDEIIELTESDKDGVYVGKTTAPKDAGEYNVDVTLVNDLGNITNKKPATKIKVMMIDFESGTDEIVVDIVEEEVEDDPETEEDESLVNQNKVKTKKIYKITNLQLTKLKTKSILSWDPISEAISYNIYKQSPGNQLVLVDNVKEPRYEVNIVGNKVTYDYFVVEPVVKGEEGETIKGQLSEVTEIQTGPKELILLLFLSLVIGFFVTKYKRKTI